MSFDPLFLKADALTAARSGRPVVEGVAFRLAPGGVLLVEGDNGAGKTTLLRLLAGLLPPAAGQVLEAASAEGPWARADLAACTHYLGHLDAVKPGLSAEENLAFWSRFAEEAPAGGPRIGAALVQVGLGHKAREAARRLSAGQRRRLALARLLLHPRPLWILDEPATALDRGSEGFLRSLFAGHRAQGGLLVAAAHGGLPLAPEGVQRLTLLAERGGQG